MAVKKCCIDNCNSCSIRKQDYGVTYHKFPKNVALNDRWISVTHIKHTVTDLPQYVCSRHFCKHDFQIYKDSKYILKSDAVPSIFPWEPDTEPEDEMDNMSVEGNSRDCDGENVDAIKKFIEAQEKEIQDKRLIDFQLSEKSSDGTDINRQSREETLSITSSVIDTIICDSELEIAKKKDGKSKAFFSPADKGSSSMALSVGSKVEAKDFGEEWHPAEIIEVDYDDMEVLVHYEIDKRKHDEWISVSSPRLRPASISYSSASSTVTVKPGPSSEESLTDSIPIANLKEESKDQKEDKAKLEFAVGERCLARWRDNRRFIATILKDLGDGNFEVLFDDGCHWTCNTSRLYKLRTKKGAATASPASRPFGTGPSNAQPNTQPPVFHTHLFDPTRDYLGSKKERRDMKRKLNIKEIFNIGQKRPKKQKNPEEKTLKVVERKPRVMKKMIKLKLASEEKIEPKAELPAVDAVASIIGTVNQEEPIKEEVTTIEKQEEVVEKIEVEVKQDIQIDVEEIEQTGVIKNDDLIQLEDLKGELDPVLEEEVILEQFEKPDDVKHEEVIDRIKEVINKLEDGINQAIKMSSPKSEPKEEVGTSPEVKPPETANEEKPSETPTERVKTKKLSKVKKVKKLRLLRAKKVKKQVEKVKSELEEMRKQMNEMRKQMLTSQRSLSKKEPIAELPESFLLPGEWCCRWLNGQPVGRVSELPAEQRLDPAGKPPLPRRSVQVEDKRLPEGWTKHMVRRSFGHSAGKWDVVLISPDNRRFHTKNEMRVYLENNPDLNLREYSHALTDFGVHLKLARRMGWACLTPDGAAPGPAAPPAATLCSTSPLIKRKKLSLRKETKVKQRRPKAPVKIPPQAGEGPSEVAADPSPSSASLDEGAAAIEVNLDNPPLEDGYVFVGSLKVQIIDNLLRCPADNCFKNFRNNTLLQMHIKHYHRELRKMMGATPKVQDLAYARTMPVEVETPRVKEDSKIIKVKIPRPPKREEPKREEPKPEVKEVNNELQVDTAHMSPVKEGDHVPIPKSQDSPKLRQALINKPVKRPKVLLPVRRPEPEPEPVIPEPMLEDIEVEYEDKLPMESILDIPCLESPLDFESAISTHTVTKPYDKRRKGEKKRKSFSFALKRPLSEEEWCGDISDMDTRSSFPRSGTPDSKFDMKPLALSETVEEVKPPSNQYMYTENGERIKLVRMKREEIINCHCGYREEDGLMVQCELCLCWQHALCHNIQRECDVPEKYTCSICLNPRRGRRSQRFLHDQDRMYEGLLPGGKPCESLRRAHELAGNLLRVQDALHALRVKYYVATKKDHPKLYLWAKDWEKAEIQYTQEKLNSDYSDLNIVINADKENLPIKPDVTPSDDHDRYMHRDGPLGSQPLLSGMMSSPGAEAFDLPISTSELERLAKSVQDQEVQRTTIAAPEPEAAIENSACRERLLKHVQRCQALVDARLDSIDAQVAELESQNPSLEDDETAEFFPRTKQTIKMLMRDLETMEELGIIT